MNAPTYIPILQQRWNNVCRVFSLAATLWDACAFCGTWLTRQRWHAARRFKVGPFLAWVRPVDFSALDEILTAREYDCTRRILSQAGPAPLVIDAGANIGLFALTAFATRPDAVVHSLEPGARTFEVLQRNAASNPSLAWHVHRLALWKSSGPLKFGVAQASTASRAYESAPAGQAEEVTAVTLTGFAGQHVRGDITLLKLDIEGAEDGVLTEAEALLPHVQHLILEIHPPHADEARVMDTLHRHFPHLHRVPGRRSAKPLILASRTHIELPA